MEEKYVELAVEKTLQLLAIDSPSGYTAKAAQWVYDQFNNMGYTAKITNKGGVLVELGGQGNGLFLQAHTDTLGAMVAEIKGNGRLRLTRLGGLTAANTETENCRVYTRDGKIYEGTLQLINASLHVNPQFNSIERTFDSMEVVLDENVKNSDDVRKLSIEVGDIVCFDPRSHVTASGYIKSRFLDDKLSVGMLIALGQYIKDNKIELNRKVYVHVTVYEEVGHGGASPIPADITESISVDMGCVGTGLNCTEHEVSICVKDSGGPYDYQMVSDLIASAKKEGAAYALDVYPMYGSDVEVTLKAGNDIRHGCIGAGVYASHGYERSHKDGVRNTLKVLKGYLNI